MNRTRVGVLGVLAAALLFSTSGTSKALLAGDAWPPSVAAVRLLVGAAGMVALITRGGKLSDVGRLLRQPVVWIMGAAVAGYQAFFFIGVQETGVATGTLVALGMAPLIAGGLGWLLREGSPGWTWALATAVALVGLALLTTGRQAVPLGVLAALLAAVSYAGYTVLGARLARDGQDSSAVLTAAFVLGAGLTAPLLMGAGWVAGPEGLLLAFWLGLMATSVAYLLFGLGLPVLQPGHIATLTLLEPVGATLLGVVVLGERLSVSGWMGCMLILAALAVLGLGEHR
jgi:DME family drug/metabolite transporter